MLQKWAAVARLNSLWNTTKLKAVRPRQRFEYSVNVNYSLILIADWFRSGV
jgi:hypothetical protein